MSANDSDTMPKRFWVGPLGVHDDDWLTIWAWLNNRSKSAQAGSLISSRIRANQTQIEAMLSYTADRMGLTPDELRRQILRKEITPGDVELPEDDE
ncbi:hypothetical protein IQ265_13710 [Nodosilinea sp. LEGE 06152]|uniref:hypothetical protein n=1 Tax=Nodosilinea sp. LEGE 06152 TaxID=2777966 RepID=UPI001882B33C|nr:hypothetical protein [Nodosilinea sp. LEGE 06152]MBE9157872.1 hypothetical protein [Nodosilinea sp. LEGE 06152]